MKFLSNSIVWVLSSLIKIYQIVISPLLGQNCRHYPTCSSYSLEALKLHGPLKGSWLSFKRIIRCHPWGTSGWDPVPAVKKKTKK
jgi:putative membrane protein insertion efficiency factor